MVIRISKIKNCHKGADEFFDDICNFNYMNYKKVQIE
ncbi:hypothetical protein ZEAMMB73_Zm00001d033107 [Zea mays]|uniref:Uncharacterized protein n=1 Tax=Zea mays TaxID=4577 RepID=A0A1D6KWC3_MAIZE|nr:hypothetical protein ZEAMMB73_Zm00001d033107 [Zea mays]